MENWRSTARRRKPRSRFVVIHGVPPVFWVSAETKGVLQPAAYLLEVPLAAGLNHVSGEPLKLFF